jgi:hypothetical protein
MFGYKGDTNGLRRISERFSTFGNIHEGSQEVGGKPFAAGEPAAVTFPHTL